MKKKELKRENDSLKNKNNHLAKIISALSESITDRDNEIDKLKSISSTSPQFSEALKKSEEFLSTLKTHGVSSDDAISALRSGNGVQFLSFDDIENDVDNFSSRFMPNVKFSFKKEDVAFHKFIEENCNVITNCDGYGEIDKDGERVGLSSEHYFFKIKKEIVSIYEAVPELVPEEMFYDKKSDSLVGKDVAFKVTEVVSKCDSCAKKDGCFVLSQLDSQPTITECEDSKVFPDEFIKNVSRNIGEKMIIDDFTRQIDDITTIAFNKLDKLLKK